MHLILQEIWQDLELSDVAKEQQLKDITERALGVWSGAVEHAENHRKGIRRRIDDAASEMRSIAELLGELAAIEDPNSSMVGPLSICDPVRQQAAANCNSFPVNPFIRNSRGTQLQGPPRQAFHRCKASFICSGHFCERENSCIAHSHLFAELHRLQLCRCHCSSAQARHSSVSLMR